MNEELNLAVEEYRQKPPNATWLIPIRFDDCPIPEWDLGGGRMLSDVNHVDLFGDSLMEQIVKLVYTVSNLFVRDTPNESDVDAVADAIEPLIGDESTEAPPAPDSIPDSVSPPQRKPPWLSNARPQLLPPVRNIQPYDVVLAPVISEKSFELTKDGQYQFIVNPRANKTQIKNAVEKLFDVKVRRVGTVNTVGKRRNVKRATVTLAPGQKAIDINRIGLR